MGMRLTTSHGPRATSVWRPIAAHIVALALVAMLGVTSVSATSATACRVQNTDMGKSFTALPSPPSMPRSEATVSRFAVRAVVAPSSTGSGQIMIVGVPEADPKRSPTLSGGDDARVIVVRKALKVRIEGLRIQRREDACVRGSQE